MKIATVIVAALCILTSCGGAQKAGNTTDNQTVAADSTVRPDYARGFTMAAGPEGSTLLTISDPEEGSKHAAQEWRFALMPRGSAASTPEGYTRIDVPVERAICMTSLQLSNFIALGETERIAGVTSTRHLFNPEVNSQLKTGKTKKIGIEGNFDHEVVMALRPDVILISPFKRGGYEALRDADAPLMPHLGYKEPTPLGQAEWIKVAGLLTGNYDEAVEKFDSIAERYNRLRDMA
ncbi:MAG: ABC transporter substrate-binding protein, partial [Paramuribaculum sp.]|nr:ABC transporter substrate-binding protein [Paramuribaculum sp.]